MAKEYGREKKMNLFEIICGVCSIAGLLVSIFTASKVVKIVQTFNCGNKDDHSKVIDKSRGNTYHGPHAGRDMINERKNNEQKW